MIQCKICGSQQISGYIICGDCEKEIKLLKTKLKQAVEDLETAESCITCEHDWDCEYSNSNGCSIANYKWRGPQDEEGDTE